MQPALELAKPVRATVDSGESNAEGDDTWRDRAPYQALGSCWPHRILLFLLIF